MIPDLLLLTSTVIAFVDSYSAGKIRIKNPHVSLVLFFILLIFLLISFTWGNLSIYGFIMRGRYILGAFLFYFMTNIYLDDKTF